MHAGIRSRITRLLAAGTVALLGAAGSLVLVAAPADAAVVCPTYYFIGARGSNESPQGRSSDYSASNNYGMGSPVYKVFRQVQAAVARNKQTVEPAPVHFPAVSVWGTPTSDINGLGALTHLGVLGGYSASVREGTNYATSQLESLHASCPAARFLLSGYSQGAQAVGDALQRMPAADRALVKAAAFFGDPYFNTSDSASDYGNFDANYFGSLGERPTYGSNFSGKVYSYCSNFDPICGLSYKVGPIGIRNYTRIWNHAGHHANQLLAEHGKYAQDGSTTDPASIAAGYIGRALGVTPPTTKAPLDLVFNIDSTGSMDDEISGVEDNVVGLAKTIAANSTSYRFALVDFKDSADQGDPYQARVDVPFTTDTRAFEAGVRAISVGGGGDVPESMYAGVMTAFSLPWRAGVKKAVITISDAPGKDPEPVTGNTLASVTQRALALDPAQVYSVPVGNNGDAQAFMRDLADATGGTTTIASSQSDFIDSLTSAIEQAGQAPVANVSGPYDATVGTPLKLSAAGTVDLADPAVKYEWNFGTGTPVGSYDTTTTTPATEFTYTAPGTYSLTLRVTTQSGLAGLATTTVTVVNAPTSKPSMPTRLIASASSTTAIALSWSAAGGVAPDFYVVRDGAGSILAAFSADPSSRGPATYEDVALAPGTYSYTVTAGNQLGESDPAGPVSATLAGAQPPTSTTGRVPQGGGQPELPATGPRVPTRELLAAGGAALVAGLMLLVIGVSAGRARARQLVERR